MPMGLAKNHDPFDSRSRPSSANSNGHVFGVTNYQPEDTHPVIDFKAGLDYVTHNNRSFLSFEQNDDISENYCSVWEENQIRCNYQHPKGSTTSSYGCMKENPHGGKPFGWLNAEENGGGTIQEFESNNKRPHMGESTQALKRQCASSTSRRRNKPKSTPPSKDPQSIAAKSRRERISERLKILQGLVPNSSKVEKQHPAGRVSKLGEGSFYRRTVTMLEKAISYVKFLQLQVKVLATDEFGPVQGGKAPDLSQVKEAIDAILSSPKDRSSKFFLENPR